MENKRKIVTIYMTVGNNKEAEKIAFNLVENRLAACVNIIPKMQAVYRWKGNIEIGDEVILLAKTTKEKVDRVIKKVKEIHSYEVPCIEVINIHGGLREYLDFVIEETGGSEGKRQGR